MAFNRVKEGLGSMWRWVGGAAKAGLDSMTNFANEHPKIAEAVWNGAKAGLSTLSPVAGLAMDTAQKSLVNYLPEGRMKSALESVSGMKKMTRTKINQDYKPEESTDMIGKHLPTTNFIPIPTSPNPVRKQRVKKLIKTNETKKTRKKKKVKRKNKQRN